MAYIVLTLVSAVFLAFYDFFKKVSVRRDNDVYKILFFYTFTAFILSVIYVNEAFTTDLKYILFTLLKAGVISVNWFLTTKAVSKLDLGIVTPFSMLGTIFTTIFAWILFGQDIGLVQIGVDENIQYIKNVDGINVFGHLDINGLYLTNDNINKCIKSI